ncbi:MAG: D-alanyl-D-alanine carboxypeptidase fraction A [Firmicutes bacterium ADurb.Bin419]|nr:MAG: D-alanyl-D-alanine carboxypeptidase fraction A [Firmicutes bacterium ADurb.Bin419]
MKNGKKASVPIKLDSDIKVFVPISREKDLQTVISKDSQNLNAPVSADMSSGKLEVKLDGKTLGSSSLSTSESIEKSGFFHRFFGGLRNLFSFLWK